MTRKLFDEILNYTSLLTAIVAQIIVGDFFVAGQACFAAANIFRIIRDFRTQATLSDLIRDFAFLGISIGMIFLDIMPKVSIILQVALPLIVCIVFVIIAAVIGVISYEKGKEMKKTIDKK